MSFKNCFAGVAAIAFIAGATAAPANASVLFTDLGAGDSYNGGTGWTASGAASNIGNEYAPASEFTAATNGKVAEIDVALGHVSGTNGATISLFDDAGGALGAQLGSWDVSGLPVFGGNSAGALTAIKGINGVTLNAGHSYFLQVSTPSDTWDAWNWNSVGTSSTFLTNGENEGSNTTGAFQVLSAAPEPATWASMLLGLGLLGAGLRLQRRKEPLAALA
jgi:hypothetical protein